MLAKLGDETRGAILGDVRAKALVTVLADAQAQVGNEKLGHTFSDVEANAPFYTLASTQ